MVEQLEMANSARCAVEDPPDGSLGAILRLEGEIDVASAPALRDHLASSLEASEDRLAVDLTRVSFIDSLTVAALIAAHHKLPRDGRLAVVVAPGSYVELVLTATGLHAALHTFASLDEAVAHLREGWTASI